MTRLPSLIQTKRRFAEAPIRLLALVGCLSIFMPGSITRAEDRLSDDAAELADVNQTTSSAMPKTIAGRSLTETVNETRSQNRFARLRAIRSLRPFGDPAAKALTELLSHEDTAARYLAAEAIGDLTPPAMKPALESLRKMARQDDSKAVQMAAAYAMCQAGEVDDFLPILLDRLNHPDRGMVCSAAMLIGQIGPRASAAIETLEQVFEDNKPKSPGDYHKGGAAKNALRKLGAIQ